MTKFISRGPTLYFFCSLVLLALALNHASASIGESRRTAVVQAVERVQPSVVSLHVRYRERVQHLYRYRGDPFWNFFSPYYFVPRDQDRVSTGSGFVVDDEGYILTNSHVVGDPRQLQKITISLPEPDSRTFEARYVASDPNFDLAVLKVDDGNMPVAPLGTSGDILVGEWAIAIGNPFDLGPTVSIGVVSALDRDFSEPQGDYYYRDMIQTDAAINLGNSGGPLVNAEGEVIGINSFIYTGGEYANGSIGIGFAIPIDTAASFLEEIRQYGQVRRSWTGILAVQDITPPLAEYLRLDSTDGVLVVRVANDSPAALAGLEKGDVIVAVNDEKIRSADEAIGVLRGLRVGASAALGVVRHNENYNLDLTLEERPYRTRR
ncbi:MAG: trypsin-like serine protease [Gemmatimonadetes bacterium]|nr:trypsin-like serine protease [Gemmatimonadota bacterium]MYB67009.1 trypsin-like serine protease [Gemmatimonadota bacterium]